MFWPKNLIIQSPNKAPESNSSVPGFSQIKMGETRENRFDENEILVDKDQTGHTTLRSTVERFNMTDTALEPLEDLPGDFMRGEIDVKKQMDLAASAMDSSLRGLQHQGYENSPRGEMGASFRDTPGGIEEVAAKTDEFIATHAKSKRRSRRALKGF
ncbi:MAG TPA: hypothetical protein VN132_07640 [Bdellovibrio sp.]|nr:hypothetical protein [Bdellovibrio sp.]